MYGNKYTHQLLYKHKSFFRHNSKQPHWYLLYLLPLINFLTFFFGQLRFRQDGYAIAYEWKISTTKRIVNMNITINNPALLFPAISLIMLAYTNRFLAVASLIRNLHMRYKANENDVDLPVQIKHLQVRMQLIKYMQFLGVSSFIFALFSMFLMYVNWMESALVTYAAAVLIMAFSLIISLIEIQQSTKALDIALRDMEECKTK